MNKIVAIIVLILISFKVFSQDISKEKFSKAVAYVNCKCVEFSLSHILNPNPILDSFHKNCDCENNPDFKTIKSAIPIRIKKTINLSQAIDSINEDNIQNYSVNYVVGYLSDSIFLKKSKLKDFNKNKGTDSLRLQIKNHLLILLKPSEKGTNSPLQTTKIPNLNNPDGESNINQQPNTLSQLFTMPIIILSAVVLLLLILIFVLITKVYSKNIPDFLKNYIKYKIEKGQSFSGTDISSINHSFDKTRNIESQIIEINEAISKMKNSISDIELKYNSSGGQYASSSRSQDDTKRNSYGKEVFYLSTPNSDGSFDKNDAKSSYSESASIYKFTKESDTKATFILEENDDAVKRAIQYPDKRIDPVCEALNAFNPNSKKIKTETPGMAELIGDKWVVSSSKKAKIRFE